MITLTVPQPRVPSMFGKELRAIAGHTLKIYAPNNGAWIQTTDSFALRAPDISLTFDRVFTVTSAFVQAKVREHMQAHAPAGVTLKFLPVDGGYSSQQELEAERAAFEAVFGASLEQGLCSVSEKLEN